MPRDLENLYQFYQILDNAQSLMQLLHVTLVAQNSNIRSGNVAWKFQHNGITMLHSNDIGSQGGTP